MEFLHLYCLNCWINFGHAVFTHAVKKYFHRKTVSSTGRRTLDYLSYRAVSQIFCTSDNNDSTKRRLV